MLDSLRNFGPVEWCETASVWESEVTTYQSEVDVIDAWFSFDSKNRNKLLRCHVV